MPVVGNLSVSMSANSAPFEAGMRRAQKSVQEMGTTVATIQGTISGLGTALLTASVGALSLQALAQGVVSFAQSVQETGAKMNALRTGLAALTGSASQGRQEFAVLTTTATRLGVDIESLSASYVGLVAATKGTSLAGVETQQLFVALTGAAKSFGLSTEQTGKALTTFEQIIRRGTVSLEDIRDHLGKAIPDAAGLAARAFGTTAGGLAQLLDKGVKADEFFRLLTIQLSKETPGALVQVGKGFAQLGNELVLMKDRMAREGVGKFFEDLAASAAKILAATREAAAQAAGAVQRTATRALGGESPMKLSPANAERLLVASEALTQKEEELRQAQERLRNAQDVATARGSALSPFGMETQAIPPLQREVDLLRQKQTELVATIKLEEARARQGVGLLTEPGPQFEAQEQQRLRQMVLDRQREEEATRNKFLEIDARTAQAFEEQQTAEREAEQSATRDAQQTVEAFRARGQAAEQAKDQLVRLAAGYQLTREARDEDTASQLKAQFPQDAGIQRAADMVIALAATRTAYQEDVRALEARFPAIKAEAELYDNAAQALQRYQEQLQLSGGTRDQFGRLQQITREARQVTKAEAELAALRGTGLEGDAQQILDRFRLLAKEAEPQFKQLTRMSESFADSFLSTMERATSGGIKSFKDFADSLIQDLQRIVNQEILKPALAALIKAGLSGLGNLLGPSAPSGPTSAPGTVGPDAGATSAGLGQAAGGPVLGGNPYVIGERGWEMFVPAVNGRILSHADTMDALTNAYGPAAQPGSGSQGQPIVVTNHFHGVTDMATFQRSSGQINAFLARTMQNAQRSI